MSATTETGQDEFQFFCDYVFTRSSIVLTTDKRYLVETRLGPVAQRAGLSGLGGLVQALRRGSDSQLEMAVIDAMTTNETSWFRDVTPFEALRERVLLDCIAEGARRRRLSIWSAACSTGQEPYSIAILLDSCFPEVASWTIDILATDLSATVLSRAREGRFTALEITRGLPPAHLLRYFVRDGAQFQIVDHLRRQVRFQQMNLAQPWPSMGIHDVILLRNVLIYFDPPTRQQILHDVRAHLRPGGYLLLGAAETTRELVDGLTPVSVAGTTVYRLDPP